LLLFPFSIIFGAVTRLRNIGFDTGLIPAYRPKIKTIAIGNLSVGGTGKTPFTELLIRMMGRKSNIAVVSRGYGRKSRGFLWVDENSEAQEVGDEPLQIKQNYPSVKVAVCEKRSVAIKKIETEMPEIDLILLDDAFQHRFVRAHCYILLTTYSKPFMRDYVLPAGRLREGRGGYKRADFIVMTKCPSDLSQFDMNAIKEKMKIKKNQQLYFAREKYGKAYEMFSRQPSELRAEAALLVSGIANNTTLTKKVAGLFENIESFNLPDHVEYDTSLIERITSRYQTLDQRFLTCIITTEKDAVKLMKFKSELKDVPILVLPYEHGLWDLDAFALQIERIIMS
jgi:tetraacyldisaccharide 4'-kinase